ncbi:MAG: hypothetical protein GF317_05575 [Candidatus Lokiarchaeota archaeon]|nr:hypothetical protein [Candidatus Lokiarchaeota archaeon]MBD3199277.1 hypothetical protein [Candidatus Lokiarchaeota archaeon]
MQNKSILYILVANVLWSFIPTVVSDLFNEFSVVMIIFLRFSISGVIFLLLGVGLIIANNRFLNMKNIDFSLLLSYLTTKNEGFFGMRNLLYIACLGFFGITLQIIGYFMAIKTTTISFTMVGFQLSIILIASYEHGVKLERLDVFKILYLLILVFTIGIIIFVKLRESSVNVEVPILGIYYLILFSITMSFLHVALNKDTYNNKEIILMNENKYYKIARLFIKIGLIFLIGMSFLFPFLLINILIGIDDLLIKEIFLFFNEFSNIFEIMFQWETIFVIVFSTVVPFLLIFLASMYWTPYNLTYSQWSSILNIIEPIGAITFGVLFATEFFPIEYLVIIIFLLLISILFRYAHESRNKVNAYIIINKEKGLLKNLPLDLLKIEGVSKVESLVGTYDLILHVKTNSIRDIYDLVNNKINSLKGLKDVKILFLDKIKKFK